jgi:transposase
MERLFKQCVGIDISKSTFTACVSKYYISDLQDLSEVVSFDNTKTGFNQFVKWSRKHLSKEIPAVYLMEATGVYYEPLAYHLHRLDLFVAVILPNKSKYYAKSLNIKTKTDAMDAKVLSTMGCLQNLRRWTPPAPIYRELRALTRFNAELKKNRTALLNHMEALGCSENPVSSVVSSYKKIIKNIDGAIAKNMLEIEKLIKSDEQLYAKIKRLETIKSVGFITIVTIIAETQGFELITSRKQLASYAGLDVIEKQSGSSINGRTRISKKGNVRIRAALYFPAMGATRHNKPLREDYNRITAKHPNIKMIGITALQRKLLLLIYTLWKNGQVYRENE